MSGSHLQTGGQGHKPTLTGCRERTGRVLGEQLSHKLSEKPQHKQVVCS